MNTKFLEDFAEMVELSLLQIQDDLELGSLGSWDSLASLTTISLVDRYFDIVLTNKDISSVHYFKDLQTIIQKKVVEKRDILQ